MTETVQSAGPVSVPGDSAHEAALRQRYLQLLQNPGDLSQARKKLQQLILDRGLPDETEEERKRFENHGECTLRGLVWKVLLGVGQLDAEAYIRLVERGPSDLSDKISGDTYRTFKSDDVFWQCVPELKLTRVLNAFVTTCADNKSRMSYVQGMNILVAPFLFVMPELDSYHSFTTMLQELCPLYVYPNLDGARMGATLLDECLKELDAELHDFLHQKQLHAELYAFPSILSLSGCTPPLAELLRIWDFLFAFGVHLNIVCTIAQIVIIRDKIIASDRPMALLRTLPPLDSRKVLSLTAALARKLPEDLYARLSRHPTELNVG